jgi:hypothetical protein
MAAHRSGLFARYVPAEQATFVRMACMRIDPPSNLDDPVMQEEHWVVIDAVVATTDRLDRYGGIALSLSALEQMKRQIETSNIPFAGHHNHALPIRHRNVVLDIRSTDRGTYALHLEAEVVKSDWESLGPVFGMSFATSGPIEGFDAAEGVALIAADAEWFADEDIVEAATALAQSLADRSGLEASVLPRRYYQFSVLPAAKIVIEVAWGLFSALGPNIAASVIWDGIKYLFVRRRKPKDVAQSGAETVIDIHVKNGDASIVAVVRTSDENVAEKAVESLGEAIRNITWDGPRRVLEWVDDADGGDGGWLPPKRDPDKGR